MRESGKQIPESFGRTVAEAMRTGCVPIVDANGGFVEQVPPNTGFLSDKPMEFAAAIKRIQSVREREDISRNARIHADAAFSLAAFRVRLLDAFRRAFAISRPPLE